jgi:predicted RNA-binding protein YlqC (UPF0109 family)
MKNLLAEIADHLVDYPEQVKVNVVDGGQTSVLELSVAREDIGKIIGKKGKTIMAIRTVLNAASARIKKRIIVEVLE